MRWRNIAGAFAGIALSACGFAPGFGILEDAPLYYVPVGAIANQVACEVQEFVSDQNDKKARQKVENFSLGRWRISRLASGEDRGWAARVRSSRLTVSGVELAPIPGQELI
jgi:hypothetical protein